MLGEEHVNGRIAPGMRADFTGFGADPVECPPDDLPDVPVRLTVVDGEVMFRAEPPAAAGAHERLDHGTAAVALDRLDAGGRAVASDGDRADGEPVAGPALGDPLGDQVALAVAAGPLDLLEHDGVEQLGADRLRVAGAHRRGVALERARDGPLAGGSRPPPAQASRPPRVPRRSRRARRSRRGRAAGGRCACSPG